MSRDDPRTWQAKLAAWLHDPVEKALILMRADHEEDSSISRLKELLSVDRISEELEAIARLADHWASAADRPTLPKPGEMTPEQRQDGRVLFWGRQGAVLKHPLDGEEYLLPDLYVDTASTIEKASFAALLKLVDETSDARTLFLRFWRRGPESEPPGLGLGHLWRLLPADTRIPDHSIWEHLSLASAFAGAMAGDPDGNPALLAVSLGPVQSFIAQARSTSDLWAGSHLLATLSWQAMKVVCERFGPDAVLFPSLWGVPVVDTWLEENGVGFPDAGGAGERGLQSASRRLTAPEWKRRASDANPLFVAALPNRFVALVPASEAEDVACEVEETVRSWVQEQAGEMLARLLDAADENPEAACDAREQIVRQLEGFPEVHWAVVPFAPLVTWDESAARKGKKTNITSVDGLEAALRTFYPENGRPGFLSSDQWKLLEESIESRGLVYVPNPGVLYPALYDLLDRVAAAAKTARPFGQVREEGYRCSLCGEREWLRGPGDEAHGGEPAGQRGETLWTKLAAKRPAWSRKGEHLCALCSLKRVWPDLFAKWAGRHVPELEKEKLSRYVVSTHTMALARDLLEFTRGGGDAGALGAMREEISRLAGRDRAALPRRVHDALRGVPDGDLVAKIPVALDAVREVDDEEERSGLERKIETLLGHRPEAYYAMILFDGDRMGAWVSGTDPKLQLPMEEAFHPNVAKALGEMAKGEGRIEKYLGMLRPPSPGRHQAISQALNGFALHAAPWVVEELFAGKILYAGGDDVLAMVPVDDVLPCLLTLRCAYSGTLPQGEHAVWELFGNLKKQMERIRKGHVLLGGKNGRLLRMMGRLATASAGVVIAHHQTPLQAVLRELRSAEKRAKTEGGRNAFSIALMKRAGGTTRFTAGFGFGGPGWEPSETAPTSLDALFALRDTLATEGVSRRAAYNILAWLPDLPERPTRASEGARTSVRPEAGGDGVHGARTSVRMESLEYQQLLEKSIAHQLRRQGVGWKLGGDPWARTLAAMLVETAAAESDRRGEDCSWTGHLAGLFTVAEFLAREGRAVPPDRWQQPEKETEDGEGGAA